MTIPRDTKRLCLLIGATAILVMAVVGYFISPTKPYSNPLEGIHVYPTKLYTKEREHVVGVLCEKHISNDCAVFTDAVRSVPNLRVVGDDAAAFLPEFWFVFYRNDKFTYTVMISEKQHYERDNISAFIHKGWSSNGEESPLKKDLADRLILSLLQQVD